EPHRTGPGRAAVRGPSLPGLAHRAVLQYQGRYHRDPPGHRGPPGPGTGHQAVIDYSLSDDEQAVIDAAHQVARSDDPWEGLWSGGWLDLVLDDADEGLGFLGLVAEELGYAGVVVPLPGSAALWPTLFGESCEGKRVGVVRGDHCEDGAGADLLVVRPNGYDDFEVEPVGGLEGDGLGRVVRLGEPLVECADVDAL